MDGIIVVNKPKGKTSFEVVSFVRSLTGVKKVGHTGTLDPLATGVLTICLGCATKLVPKLMAQDKEYQGEIVFGITTDSCDAAGKILTQMEVSLTRQQVEAAMEEFIGKTEQIPPMVSALHHKGERLYDLARQGKVVERAPRPVLISDFRLIDFQDGGNPKAAFVLTCSKGTYVRTLCYDLGQKLGCGAYQSELIRTRNGVFKLPEAYSLEDLEKLSEENRMQDAIISIDKVLRLIKAAK